MELTVNNTPIADALALHAAASLFDAQRGKLSRAEDLRRSPDGVAVARQISELGQLITDLGDEVLFRAASRDREPHTARATTGFAAAIRPAGKAASALGAVAHQLSFLHQTEHLRDQPDARDAREAAVRVMDDALGVADTALCEAADSLHAASATVAPPAARLQAARHRSTTATPAPSPVDAPAVAVAPDRTTRSR